MHVIVVLESRSAYNNLSWFTSSDLFAVFHLDFSFNLKPTQEYTGERWPYRRPTSMQMRFLTSKRVNW